MGDRTAGLREGSTNLKVGSLTNGCNYLTKIHALRRMDLEWFRAPENLHRLLAAHVILKAQGPLTITILVQIAVIVE